MARKQTSTGRGDTKATANDATEIRREAGKMPQTRRGGAAAESGLPTDARGTVAFPEPDCFWFGFSGVLKQLC